MKRGYLWVFNWLYRIKNGDLQKRSRKYQNIKAAFRY